MLISIIIPSFNNLERLKQSIVSIENQSFKNYEVWVVDGASESGTVDYLKTLKQPFNWISHEDSGIYDAMNKGITLARGQWLYFMGADDKLYGNGVLEFIFNEIPNRKIKLILGKIKYDWKKKDSMVIQFNNGIVAPSWSNKIWFRNTIHHQAVFYNKDVFTENKYSTQFKVLSDYAFNLKLYQQRERIQIIDQIITRCGTKGMSKKYDWDMYKEEIQLKSMASSLWLKPIFILIACFKFLMKKII